MDIEPIINKLRYITLPLWVKRKNNDNSFGTGFAFNYFITEDLSIPFIVTNFHVVDQGDSVITEFIKLEDKKPSSKDKIKVEIPLGNQQIFGDKELDLYLIPLGPILNKLKDEILYTGIDKSMAPNVDVINKLTALEEIIFIGYPNAIYDSKSISPIIRRGITATPMWSDFNDKKSFLIDAGVYPGSSGSPVFIFNQGSYSTDRGIALGTRLFFIGILTESPIGILDQHNKYFLGLGSVIKAEVLIQFIELLVKKITP